MDTLANLAMGFSIALTPYTLTLAIIGCFVGTIIGALPGLGPSNGVALLIPISFSMGLDAISALVLLTSVYYGAMYDGRISSILLNIPGDEPAMMTTLNGHPMAKQGKAAEALVVSGVAVFRGRDAGHDRADDLCALSGAGCLTGSARPSILPFICWLSARLAGSDPAIRPRPRWPPPSVWASR